MLREKDLDTLKDELEKLKGTGKLIEPDKLNMLYIQECNAQVSYTPEHDCKWNGDTIVDAETGKTPPSEIVKEIEARVKLLAPTMPSVADNYIKKLNNSKLRGVE